MVTPNKTITVLRFSAIVLIWSLCLVIPCKTLAHKGQAHAEEIMSLLGIHPKNNVNLRDTIWKISSFTIDGVDPFKTEVLQKEFKGFVLSKHRYLFHWNFNGIPWNSRLDECLRKYLKMRFPNDNDGGMSHYYDEKKDCFLSLEQNKKKETEASIGR